MEFILRCAEGLAGQLADLFRHLHIKALGGVQSGTDSSSAQSQLLQRL